MLFVCIDVRKGSMRPIASDRVVHEATVSVGVPVNDQFEIVGER